MFPAWSWTGGGPVACDAAGNGNGTRLFSGYSRRESYNRSGLELRDGGESGPWGPVQTGFSILQVANGQSFSAW